MKIYWNGTSKNIIDPKIKQLRTRQGLSQAALAGRLQLLGMGSDGWVPAWIMPEPDD